MPTEKETQDIIRLIDSNALRSMTVTNLAIMKDLQFAGRVYMVTKTKKGNWKIHFAL